MWLLSKCFPECLCVKFWCLAQVFSPSTCLPKACSLPDTLHKWLKLLPWCGGEVEGCLALLVYGKPIVHGSLDLVQGREEVPNRPYWWSLIPW